jgi:hypothetical protein
MATRGLSSYTLLLKWGPKATNRSVLLRLVPGVARGDLRRAESDENGLKTCIDAVKRHILESGGFSRTSGWS